MAFPFRCHSFSFKNLCRSHLRFGIGEIRIEVSQSEPHISLNVILRNTKTTHIEQPQIVRSLTCPAEVRHVLSCLSIPFSGLSVILWHTFPILIHLAQSVLRVRVAVLRCPCKPLKRCLEVGLSKPALLIPGAEPELRSFVSVLGFG